MAQLLHIEKKVSLTTKQGGNKMKKIILSVGVLFLTSFMTLTTTAFGYGKRFCYTHIEEKEWGDDTIYELLIVGAQVKTVMSSLDRVDVAKAALAYEKADKCTNLKTKPVCYIEKRKGYFISYKLFIEDEFGEKRLLEAVISSTEAKEENLVGIALDFQKAGTCIYSPSSSEKGSIVKL